MFSPELGPAAANLAEQSEATRALTAEEQQRTRTEVLAAIANLASRYEDALSKEAETISARSLERNQNSRCRITKMVDWNQEIMMQKINGLQRG